MFRATLSVLIFCLFLFGCVGQVTTPEPIIVEKIVKETVIVEEPKAIEVTVIVEKPVEVTTVVEKPVEATVVREEPPTRAEALGPAQVVILVDRLNIRSGPGTKYAVTGEFTKNTEVEVVGQYGGWYKVIWVDEERKDHTGWISGHSNHVAANEAAQNAPLVLQEEIPPPPIADTSIPVPTATPQVLDSPPVNLRDYLTKVCPTDFRFEREQGTRTYHSNTLTCNDGSSIRVAWVRGPSTGTSTIDFLVDLPDDAGCSLVPKDAVEILQRYFVCVPGANVFQQEGASIVSYGDNGQRHRLICVSNGTREAIWSSRF